MTTASDSALKASSSTLTTRETGLNLSVVVPLYNEEASIPHLVEQLLAALRPIGESFELVLVDDGSRDATAAVLSLIHI